LHLGLKVQARRAALDALDRFAERALAVLLTGKHLDSLLTDAGLALDKPRLLAEPRAW